MSALALTQHETDDHPTPEMPRGDGYACVHVRDNLNAPKYEAGDVLHVNLDCHRYLGDGCYAVEISGRQVIRFIRADASGLHVFAASDPAAAQRIAASQLRILGIVTHATTTRRVA